jgi:DNA-binding CsgD family transcriptional regulator
MVDAYYDAGRLRPEISAALGTCFDAALHPELWSDATEQLTIALGALGVCFHMQGAPAERRMLAPISASYRAMLEEFLAGGWGQLDVRAQRGWPMIQRGASVLLDDDFIAADERAHTPIYAELFRRHDMDDFAAVGFRCDDQSWVLNVVRSRGASADDPRRRADELRALQPYLARLVGFGQALAGSAAGGAMAALEATGVGAILLDWAGRVVEMNALARTHLGAGLSARGGGLVADRPDVQARLDGLVAWALSPEASRAGLGGGPMALPLPAGGALMVDALPARGELADAFGRSGALLLVTDPRARPRPAAALLRQLYGLTPREAEAAARLAAGDGVAEISEGLGLMESSVRQLIKALLWKTGARRQSELVAMMARLPDGR